MEQNNLVEPSASLESMRFQLKVLKIIKDARILCYLWVLLLVFEILNRAFAG